MDLLSFIQKISPDFLQEHPTVCFKGDSKSYPLLFFSQLFRQLKVSYALPVVSVNVEQDDVVSLFARLSTSFLGTTSFYWFKNVSALKGKKGKQLVDFLKKYNGPNGVAYFVDKSTPCTAKDISLLVQVPDKIDKKTFIAIALFLGRNISSSVVDSLFKKTRAIGLDAACLLINYLCLAGRRRSDFFDVWLDKIVAPEQSLVVLSKLFFERDAQAFFTAWSKISKDYSPQFWIAFWSDQLWRAFHFVEQLQRKQFFEAKRLSFRLPYSFTQRGWIRANLKELRSAHDFLYSIDCSLKNGGDPFRLDLFYACFFSEQFCS